MLSVTVQRPNSGLLAPGSQNTAHQWLFKAVDKAFRSEARGIRDDLRRHVGSNLAVKRKGFLKGFYAKVLNQDPNRLPGMVIGSRIPWSGVHENGVTINGKMLIPIYGRVGKKRFRAYVTELLRGGNAYFIKKNGKVILMSENIKEHDRPLAGFKRRYRKAEGIKRLKRGADIPIAVLVSKVVLRKRLDVEGVVRRRIPMLSAAIEKEIAAMFG
jgi:hypothetical protein